MRFCAFQQQGQYGIACSRDGIIYRGLTADGADFPGTLDDLIRTGGRALRNAADAFIAGAVVELARVELLPPIQAPGKVLCVGLNYADHARETNHAVPNYPTVFIRATTSLIGAGAPLHKPIESDQFDYEGEFVAVIGKRGRRISRQDALDHVVGYTLFNDATARDFQTKSSQWTMGKNFDGTGAIGPCLMTADELPPGAAGLRISTAVNDRIVQDANTDDLIFDVAQLVEIVSEVMTLEPGDLIVTGTPGGVGMARTPPLWLKPGDVVKVELEGFGALVNTVC